MTTKYGIYPFQNTDDLDAYRMDFEYSLDDNDYIRSIEFGARYSNRTYTNDRSVYEYGSDSGISTSQPPLRLTSDFTEIVNWQGDFSYFPSYLSIDLDKALDAWFPGGVPQPRQTWGGYAGVINAPEGVVQSDTSWSVLQSGEVYEEVTSAYVMANLSMEIGDMPVTGNVGIRMVDSKQASTFLQDVGGDIEEGAVLLRDEVGLVTDQFRSVILEDTYTDYLPSLNLNFQLTDNSYLRFAAAKVMGRAPINSLFANTGIRVNEPIAERNVDTGVITVTGVARTSGQSDNSPYLRPFYANQYDLSYEYYFTETEGALSVALFYKDIRSFVDKSTTDPYDFRANGFVVPDTLDLVVGEDLDGDPSTPLTPVLDANGNVVTETVEVLNGAYTTAVNNAEGGYIRGLEVSYTQIFSFLPDFWSGFGTNLSYSKTQTEITRIADPSQGIYSSDLPGLSPTVVSATLFYDNGDGFETRINGRYRDPFVSQQVGVNAQTVNFDSELVVDFQASYEINENLGVLFQANNITDEPTRSYFGSESRTGTIQYFGTQYFFGVTYSL